MKKKKNLSVPHKENLDHLREVPLKEDVDIELEYKIYLLYERLKKYKLVILGFFIGLILALVGLFLYKNYQENKLNNASIVFYNNVNNTITDKRISVEINNTRSN